MATQQAKIDVPFSFDSLFGSASPLWNELNPFASPNENIGGAPGSDYRPGSISDALRSQFNGTWGSTVLFPPLLSAQVDSISTAAGTSRLFVFRRTCFLGFRYLF